MLYQQAKILAWSARLAVKNLKLGYDLRATKKQLSKQTRILQRYVDVNRRREQVHARKCETLKRVNRERGVVKDEFVRQHGFEAFKALLQRHGVWE